MAVRPRSARRQPKGDRLNPYPGWWSRRDRWAARAGRHFWPALYLASARTRDRWAAVAEIVTAAGDDDEAALETAAFLETGGMLPHGTTAELREWYGQIPPYDVEPDDEWPM